MNDSPDKALPQELQSWFDAWRTCMQEVLSQVSSQTITFEVSSDPLPPAESDLCFTIVAGGAVRGEMSARVPSSSAVRMAQMLLGGPATSTEVTSEHNEALEELFRQIAGRAATSLASIARGEIQFHVSTSAAPSWSPAASICFRAREGVGDPLLCELQISVALSTALQPTSPQAQQDPKLDANAPASVPAPTDPQYGRLLDVGLEVKLRFGTRRMQLRDVLALSSGFVVELDNKVQSPADLLLDGRVIARGEVVVVDGKYGLRVTEIPN